MKRMLLFLALLSFALQLHAQDSTVRGGFVEYRYLGGNVYEAKLSLYVSCPYPDITPYIACKVGADTITGDTLVFVEVKDVTGIPADCPVQSKCSGDTNAMYGVMRLSWTRRFDLDTASHCNVLFFAYAGKRDAGITTGSKGETFYIDSWLDQCLSPGKNSPAMAGFKESSLMIRNQDYVLNYGTAGLGDFDSVSYVMTAGRTAPGNSISYIGNYAPSRPICYFGLCNPFWGPCPQNWPAGFHLDPMTGDIMFRPIGLCFGPIAVEISLWKRDGVGMNLASRVYREQAVQIIPDSGNHVPKILPPYSRQVCAGQQTCFTITTDDDDAGDSVFLAIESDIPGMTWQVTYDQYKHARAQVCWTPDSSQISNVPYTFLVKATDDHCGMPGNAARAFSFFVRETPKAHPTLALHNCGRVTVHAIPETTSQWMYFEWRITDSLENLVELSSDQTDTFLLKPGKYKSTFSFRTNAYCPEYHYDSFVIANYNQVEIATDPLWCFGDTVHARAVNSESHIFTYEWSKRKGSSITGANADTVGYIADTTHYLHLKVKWGAWCETSDSVLLRVVRPKKELSSSYPAYCPGDSTLLMVSNPVDSVVYAWNNGDTAQSTTVSLAGWYFLSTMYFPGCVQTDSIAVTPELLPEIDFIAPDSICPGDTATVLADMDGDPPFDFLWQDSSTLPSVSSAGGWSVLLVRDADGCLNRDSLYVARFTVPEPDSNLYTVCRGHGFHFLSGDTLGTSIYYSFGDSGNYIVPQNSGAADVWLYTANGCKAHFPIDIVINELPDPAFSYSVLTERNLLFIPSHQWNAYHYWDFGDTTTSSQMIVNHGFVSNGPFDVRLTVTDRSTGCVDSAVQQISFQVGLKTLADLGVRTFPNPFGGSVFIESPVAGHCSVYSSMGHLIWEGQLQPSVVYQVDASGWNPGVYLLRMETERGQGMEKLIRR